MIPLIEPCHAHFKPCLFKFKLGLVHIQFFFIYGNCGMHCTVKNGPAGPIHCQLAEAGKSFFCFFFQSCTFLLQVATFDNFSDYIWVLTLTCTAQRWKAERSCSAVRGNQLDCLRGRLLLRTLLVLSSSPPSLSVVMQISLLSIDFLFIPQFGHMTSVHSLQEMICLFFSSFKSVETNCYHCSRDKENLVKFGIFKNPVPRS